MSLFIPSRLEFRLGEWPIRNQFQGAAPARLPIILLFALAIFLCALPARADYLEDLTPSAPPALGFPTFGSPLGYYPAVSTGGIGVVRLSVPWKDLEPTPGQFEWAALDARIAALQALGIEPFLDFKADSESAADFGSGGNSSFVTPNSMDDWSTFVSLTVDRYNGDGWNDAPGLLRPIRYYAVTNIWANAGDRSEQQANTDAEIVAFVNHTYDAVKSVETSAVFVLGGIVDEALDTVVANRGGFGPDVWNVSQPSVQVYGPYIAVGSSDSSANFIYQGFDTGSQSFLVAGQSGGQQDVLGRSLTHSQLVVQPAAGAGQPKLGPSVEWIRSLITEMKFDAIDLRQFGTPGDPLRIGAIREVIGNVPLLSTECDSPALRYRDNFPEDQFMAVVEHNLTDLSESLEHCLRFRLDPDSDANGGDSQMAPLDEDVVDEPGHAAYSMLAFILQDMTAVERGVGNSFTIYRADNPPLVVAWLEDDQLSGTLTLPDDVAGSVMRVTDPVLGTYEIEPPVDGGWVVLSQWPLVAGELPWAEMASVPNIAGWRP